MSQATIDVLTGSGFLAGALAGILALVISFVAGSAMRGDRSGPLPWAGTAIGLVALPALGSAVDVPVVFPVGLAALWVAGTLARSAWVAAALAVPGAALVAAAAPDPGWVGVFLFFSIVVSAPLVRSFDRAYGPTSIVLPVLALAVIGIFFTVPDTEAPVVLVGIMAVAVFLGWPRPIFSLGGGGSFAVVGLAAWVAGTGVHGRPAAVVAAVGCLGILVVEPLVRRLASGRTTLPAPRGDAWIPAGLVQLGVVFALSRVAGVRASVAEAAILTLAVLGATAGIVILARRPGRRADPDPGSALHGSHRSGG